MADCLSWINVIRADDEPNDEDENSTEAEPTENEKKLILKN